MGFDLYGVSPQITGTTPISPGMDAPEEAVTKYLEENKIFEANNPGVYFRNNVWWWRPLWDYVYEVCDSVLTEEDYHSGQSNEGHTIDENKCVRMALLLNVELSTDKTQEYTDTYRKTMDDMPKEKCDLCDGTGTRNNSNREGECNGCNGNGIRSSWVTNYPFDVENVREFVAFLKECGGFQIC
tara:strand:- start:57 stop:608 length:552 start_codon:yes stop_codon:yes gene_type:complete